MNSKNANLVPINKFYMKPLLKRLSVILCIIPFCFVNSCNKNSDLPPDVETGDMVNNGQGSITLKGTVNPHGSWTMVWFDYGETTFYGEDETASEVMYGGLETIEVYADIEIIGLEYNKNYHYRIAAENEIGTTYGKDKTFIIPALCKNCQQITYDQNNNIISTGTAAQYCGAELITIQSAPPVVIGNTTVKWVCQ